MTKENQKKRILIVTTSLANGGAERFVSNLSYILNDLNFEVHIALVLNKIEFEHKATLLNLGLLKDKDNTLFGKIKRFFVFNNYIKKNKFDYIIDNRTRLKPINEIVINKLIYRSCKAIYMVHSYKIDSYITPNNFVRNYIFKKAYRNVCVSKEIQQQIQEKYRFENCQTIYNPFYPIQKEKDFNGTKISGNYILAYGRINDDIKNFSLLIDAYSKSNLRQKGIKLYIMGDGKDVEVLKNKVLTIGLHEFIQFHPKIKNPFSVVENALFTVLTSRYEGFPSVLVESLSLGTPVVSVNCKSGPAEIVSNEYNGLLVENNDSLALSQVMNRMIEDKELYFNCKQNAKKSVEHLSVENISKEWEVLLKG